jgi:hypothetical protein
MEKVVGYVDLDPKGRGLRRSDQLLLNQFNPPIPGPSFISGIVRNGLGICETLRRQAIRIDSERNQPRHFSFRSEIRDVLPAVGIVDLGFANADSARSG